MAALHPHPIVSDFKYQFGRLVYRVRSTGSIRGHEDWWLTGNRDGTSTLRSLSISYDTQVVGDAVLTRRGDGRPVDGFLRLQIADCPVGAVRFNVEDERVEVSASGRSAGSIEQTLRPPPGIFSLLTSSIMHQGWAVYNYDKEKDGAQLRPFFSILRSTTVDSGSLVAKLNRYRVLILPDEEVTVTAGTFRATPFVIDQSAFGGAETKYWVAGGDRILLRSEIESLDESCELISWTREL